MSKFGSVAWQEEREKQITEKMSNKIPLNAEDRAYLTVQTMHLDRILKEKSHNLTFKVKQ